MATSTISIQPLIHELRKATTNTQQTWFADDSFVIGSIQSITTLGQHNIKDYIWILPKTCIQTSWLSKIKNYEIKLNAFSKTLAEKSQAGWILH